MQFWVPLAAHSDQAIPYAVGGEMIYVTMRMINAASGYFRTDRRGGHEKALPAPARNLQRFLFQLHRPPTNLSGGHNDTARP